MAKRYDQLADELDELALYLRLKDRSRLARDCQIASSKIKQIDFIPPDPCEVNRVSSSVREYIGDFRSYGEIPKLEEMREENPYMSELTRISKIGPKRAKKIHDQTGAETISDIRSLDKEGKLEQVNGIGPKTATTIRRSIAQLE